MIIKKIAVGFSPIYWRSLAALLLALIAQSTLEPPAHIAPAVVFYWAALGFLIWAVMEGEWKLSELPVKTTPYGAQRIRIMPLLLSAPLLIAAFFLFSGNRFN